MITEKEEILKNKTDEELIALFHKLSNIERSYSRYSWYSSNKDERHKIMFVATLRWEIYFTLKQKGLL